MQMLSYTYTIYSANTKHYEIESKLNSLVFSAYQAYQTVVQESL